MNNATTAIRPDKTTQRKTAMSDKPSVLTDIYDDQVNLVVWQNTLTNTVNQDIKQLLVEATHLKAILTATPDNIVSELSEHSHSLNDKHSLCQYISTLVDMFCTLFELKAVGLRLTILDEAMCPKFHVDHVPCRLITTFSGIGTQWLPHSKVDRRKLGAGSLGKSDESSGIMQNLDDIENLSTGDVALLKGEGWYSNEGGGLVHRSPALKNAERRLVLTLDFID
jgi:hypothetical protein